MQRLRSEPFIPSHRAIAFLPLLLAACLEPFGGDRHELEADRVAALALDPLADGPPGAFVPRPALISEGLPYADEPWTLRWGFAEEADAAYLDALDPDAPSFADGPAPILLPPEGSRWLTLVATSPGGTVCRSRLALPDPALPATDLIDLALATLPLSVADVELADLDRDARLALESTPSASVPEGGFGRLSAVYAAEPATDDIPTLRWMSTTEFGTFFELTRDNADWAAGTLVFDDEEVVSRDALPPGPRSILALALHDDGRNDWVLRELWVGEIPPGATIGSRWVSASGESLTPGLWAVTLVADDDAPTGLAFGNPQSVSAEDLPEVDPYGTEALPCAAPQTGPFDLDALASGRCLRSQVTGARVVVEAR